MLDPEGVAGTVVISGGIGFVGAANGGMVAITGSLMRALHDIQYCTEVLRCLFFDRRRFKRRTRRQPCHFGRRE